MWNTIKDLFVLSHRQDGLPLEPRFFKSKKEAQEFYIVDVCGQKLEDDVDSQFNYMARHALDCGLNVFVETVEERVKNYEDLNEYNEEEFKNREEFIQWEFYWFKNRTS
jgi:hypothetical protein